MDWSLKNREIEVMQMNLSCIISCPISDLLVGKSQKKQLGKETIR